MKRFLAPTIAFLAVAAVLGAVLRSGGAGIGAAGSADSAGPAMTPADDGFASERDLAEGGGGDGVAAPMEAYATDGVSAGEEAAVPLPNTFPGLAAPADAGAKVIKTANLSVELAEGKFEKAYREASLVASRHGGFVASSSTTKFMDARGASITLRVPANRFDQAMADLRELGEVTGEESAGEDVTAQFVDLEARLRNWEAQETVLLRLMSEANTVDESIKVQRNLSEVQLEIERIRGQLRLLRDQTDFGTINLNLSEGDPEALIKTEEEGSILGNAWRDAIEGFQNVLAATVVGLGYLIPLTALVLAGWFVVRRFRTPAAPAESA